MNVLALCKACGKQGRVPPGVTRPKWCKCAKGKGGPYVAPPGYTQAWKYEIEFEAAFREECRLASNAERQARDAMLDASGNKSSPAYRRARRLYLKAFEVLERLQALCSHPERSPYLRIMCGVCYAHVECDVEQFRHLSREIGKARAMRCLV